MIASHGEVVVHPIGAKRGTFPSVRVTGRLEKAAPVNNLRGGVCSTMADTTELW